MFVISRDTGYVAQISRQNSENASTAAGARRRDGRMM